MVFAGRERIFAAVLSPSGREIAAHLRLLIRVLRAHWLRIETLIRANSHYAAHEGRRAGEAGDGG